MKIFKKAAAIFLGLLLALPAAVLPFGVSAAESPEPVAAGVTVIEVNEEEIAENGAAWAINDALRTAEAKATDASLYKVIVPEGEYTLDGVLHIGSNTWLSLNGVTLRRGGFGNMICVGADSDGGYYFRNITVEGGVLDGALSTGTMLKLSHAKNLLLRGVTVIDNYNSHMAEVACVDGFTLSGCVFDNQKVDEGYDKAYEQVQIDVLAPGNFDGYGYEDLPVRNVLVEHCAFKNAPRGVGSHTAVLTAPHSNIVIRDNSFQNMGSAAIQTLGWENCRIVRNDIDNAVRGIAVYGTNASGTMLPSFLAEAGGTEQHFPDEYTPYKSNILIDSNNLTDCGVLSDVFAASPYEKSAVSVMGTNVISGALPQGFYYCDSVSVTNNLIRTKGNGVRVECATNVNVDGNVINSLGAGNANDYGVVCRYCEEVINIRKNFITDAPVNGIYVHKGSKIANINNNEIYYTGKYGIGIDGASVRTLSNNDIRHTVREGLAVVNGGEVTNTIIATRVIDGGTYGIHVSGDSSARMVEKNAAESCTTPFGLNGGGFSRNNLSQTMSMDSFRTDRTEVTIECGCSYRLAKTPEPLYAAATYCYSSRNEAVAVVDGNTGRITGVAEGVALVTVAGGGASAQVQVTVVGHDSAPAVGDPDGDGCVTSADVSLISGYVSRMRGYSEINTAQADVNGDGAVTAKDRILLARYAARSGGVESLPADASGIAAKGGELSLSAGEAVQGGILRVDVLLTRSSGIATAEIELTFDDRVFTLESVEDGGLIEGATAEHSDCMSSPYHLSWANDLAETDSTACGRLATLRFRVADGAPAGEYRIGWNTAASEYYNSCLESVPFDCGEAVVTVNALILAGDADGDGVVSISDVTAVQREIAEFGPVPNPAAADVDGDGAITVGDATLIQRILAELA